MSNLAVRTLSGIGFVLVMLAGLLVDKFLFAALVLFVMAVSMHEFYRMTIGEGYRTQRILATVTGCILFSIVFLSCAFKVSGKYLSLIMVPVIILMISSLYAKDRSDFKRLSHIYTGLLYIAAPFSLANIIAFQRGRVQRTPPALFLHLMSTDKSFKQYITDISKMLVPVDK